MILTAERESVGAKVLSRLLPKFVKRVVFLATLFCSIEAVRGVLQPRLQAMNEELKLVHDTDILKRCTAFTKLVWRHGCPVALDSQAPTDFAKIVDEAPKCLLYGTRDEIANDIVRLMMCRVS